MPIKQTTKEQYDLLTLPNGQFSVILAEELSQKCRNAREEGRNIIIDASGIEAIEPNSLDGLMALQHAAYEQEVSWVMAGLPNEFQPEQEDEEEFPLNFTPTLEEAIDIVSMEILERDLMRDFDDEEI